MHLPGRGAMRPIASRAGGPISEMAGSGVVGP